jgi:hypothetical protein
MMDYDYEIIEGDDDLFADHVDEDEDRVKKPCVDGKEKVERDGDSERDDLWALDSNDDKETFREDDLKDPNFKFVQLFETIEVLRKAIRWHSCLQRREIKMPINDKRRLCARCQEACSFYFWASYDSIHKA